MNKIRNKKQFTATILSARITNVDGVEPVASFVMQTESTAGKAGYIIEHYSLLKQDDTYELASLIVAADVGRMKTPESIKKLEGQKVFVSQTLVEVDGELAMMREFTPYQVTDNNRTRKEEKR